MKREEEMKTVNVTRLQAIQPLVFRGGVNLGGVKSRNFSRKFKNKSDFILNSGNFCITLQHELCPAGPWESGCGRDIDKVWREKRKQEKANKVSINIQNLKIMEMKMNYVAPELEVLEVMVEQGFQASKPTGGASEDTNW